MRPNPRSNCLYWQGVCNVSLFSTMSALFAVFTIFFATVASEMSEDEFYTRVFEEVDPDFILDNERILQAYLKCFFSEADCNAHAALVKKVIPINLATVCGKCTEKQKGIFKYTLNKFIPAHPKDWDRILEIYDPEGTGWPNVKAFLES